MVVKSPHLVTTNYPGLVIEPLEGKDWKVYMDDALGIIHMSGFEWQLGSGTLLGMIREKDHYIHYDTDIDIDIIERQEYRYDFTDRVGRLVRIMKEAGFNVARTQFYQKLPMQIAFIHKDSKIIIDLCFFYDDWGDGSNYYNIYEHGIFIRPKYSVDETTTIPIGDNHYTIPKNYEKYLIGRYGWDWRVPKGAKQSGEKDAAEYLILL